MLLYWIPTFFIPRFAFVFTAVLLLGASGCAAPVKQETNTSAAKPNPPLPTALDEYIAREEPNYKWEIAGEETSAQSRIASLKLTSQTWQGKDWTHRVEVVQPAKTEFPGTALLFISMGRGSAQETFFAQLLAGNLGATVINVFNVPNQPFEGKQEDDLIAHTFEKFLQTGDTTWPLLLPMTKSAIKAMDAAQEYSHQKKWDTPLEKFIVAGASKRGWTSWLVAAAEAKNKNKNRVAGIIPLVYNNLNIPKQLPHQLESWGKFSEQIEDYTRRGLQEQMTTPRGQQLVAIVDPYTYRERLTMPKFLINGTNDRYWALDATRFYVDDLPGSTNLYFAPNAGHDLGGDYMNVLSTAGAWFRWVASGKEIPTAEVRHAIRSENGRDIIATVSPGAQVQLRIARSKNRDFRDAKWQTMPMKADGSHDHKPTYRAHIGAASTDAPYIAAFVEAVYKGESAPLRISSPVLIWNGLASASLQNSKANDCPFRRQGSAIIPISYGSIPLTDDLRRKGSWGEFFGAGCDVQKEKWHCRRCDREF